MRNIFESLASGALHYVFVSEDLCAGWPHQSASGGQSAQTVVPSFSTIYLLCDSHSVLPWFSEDSPEFGITIYHISLRLIQAIVVVMSQDDAFWNVLIEPETSKSQGRLVLNFH